MTVVEWVEVPAHRAGEQHRVLRDDGDLTAQVVQSKLCDLNPIYRYLSLQRGQKMNVNTSYRTNLVIE